LPQQFDRPVASGRPQRQKVVGPTKAHVGPINDAPPLFANRDSPASAIAQIDNV
jgi:hypothetical protein